MGTKNNPGEFDCYAAAEPDEPMFTLLGRDPMAGELVRLWASAREAAGEDPAKCAEAYRCAAQLDEWVLRQGKQPVSFVSSIEKLWRDASKLVADHARGLLEARGIIVRLTSQLGKAALWFSEYADGHYAKGATEKAQLNRARAHACLAAMGPQTPVSLELRKLYALVDDFADEMKAKLLRKHAEGWTGWDDPSSAERLKEMLFHHVRRNGQYVDTANLAAFLWQHAGRPTVGTRAFNPDVAGSSPARPSTDDER